MINTPDAAQSSPMLKSEEPVMCVEPVEARPSTGSGRIRTLVVRRQAGNAGDRSGVVGRRHRLGSSGWSRGVERLIIVSIDVPALHALGVKPQTTGRKWSLLSACSRSSTTARTVAVLRTRRRSAISRWNTQRRVFRRPWLLAATNLARHRHASSFPRLMRKTWPSG